MKADLVAVARDYGFGSLTIVVSVVNATDGTPITDVGERNFDIRAVQTPSGWATNDVLKIKSGIHNPTGGVYVFSAGNSGNKKLAAGPYTLVITLTGARGRPQVNGQTLAAATIH